MARIRTIKPELPQSGSMGRISREARLCFILMWTLADDAGRLRGDSRMLASLLYPYDDDARGLMEGWLTELQREKCIVRYTVDGDQYIEICNWLTHQKIDRPSKSKIPSFAESSRALASPRERSSGDQGSEDQGPKDQGPKDQGAREAFLPEAAVDPHRVTEDVKAIYPAGMHRGDHWTLAEREIGFRLDEGVTAKTLIEAARSYAAQQSALGKLGTEAVMRPNNFFNGTGAWRGPFPLPPPPKSFADRQADGVRERFLKGTA